VSILPELLNVTPGYGLSLKPYQWLWLGYLVCKLLAACSVSTGVDGVINKFRWMGTFIHKLC